jgi:glycosyltransferase involved in cell wall biosynthesis
MSVTVNGRFLSQRVTGVERYARELVARLGNPATVVAPNAPVRGVRGHLWEQGVLPRLVRGALLWSPCNTGPLSVAHQVVTIHDCGFYDHAECFSRAFATWYRWLIPRLARRARRVITVSHFSRRRLTEFARVAEEQIVVIPNGVGRQFAPVDSDTIARTKQELGLPARYVLSVGSLDPRKNLARLLEAWRQLPTDDWGLKLLLVGGSHQNFQAVGLAHDVPNVAMAGYVDDEHLPAVYSGAELFVFPSLYEGFGLPVLEAMACGTAVVCSHATSLPEVAGDAAVLVDPREPEAIAAGIRRVLEDGELRASLGRRGLARAGQYTWESAAQSTWQVLEAAAERN